MKKMILFLTLLSGVLLMGRRFDATWAGGEGYLPQQAAKRESGLGPETLLRGQIVTTGNATASYRLNNSTIFLDQQTTVALLDARSGHTAWRLDTGRVVLSGEADVHMRENLVSINGKGTIVHYNWLNKADALLFSGTGSINSTPLIVSSAQSLDTLTQMLSPTTFSTTATPIKDFYLWALSTSNVL